MFLVSSDRFPSADGKTEIVNTRLLRNGSILTMKKIPITETTTLSNRKHEKKKKIRKLPL